MIPEILLGAAGYTPIALVTARHIKFALENETDRANQVRLAEKAKCPTETYGHAFCDHAAKTYRQEWGNAYTLFPLFGGLLWPLTGVGAVGYYTWKGVKLTTGPFFRWFFENPKHRKKKNATNTLVRRAKQV